MIRLKSHRRRTNNKFDKNAPLVIEELPESSVGLSMNGNDS